MGIAPALVGEIDSFVRDMLARIEFGYDTAKETARAFIDGHAMTVVPQASWLFRAEVSSPDQLRHAETGLAYYAHFPSTAESVAGLMSEPARKCLFDLLLRLPVFVLDGITQHRQDALLQDMKGRCIDYSQLRGLAPHSDVDALNRALNALNALGVAIGLVSEYLAKVQQHAQGYVLEFDQQDNLVRISYRYSGEEIWPKSGGSDYWIQIQSSCEWLPKHVKELWQAYHKADQSIAALPLRIVAKLDALTRCPWVASMRLNCLDLIVKWPGEMHHQTSLAATKVAGTISDLLKHAAAHEPFSAWDRYQALIQQYRDELYAIRDTVLPRAETYSLPTPTPHGVPDAAPAEIRANNYKLFPKGPLTDRDITELVIELNTHKNADKSLNQIARDYTGESRGNDKRAMSLLAAIRRLKKEGRVNY